MGGFERTRANATAQFGFVNRLSGEPKTRLIGGQSFELATARVSVGSGCQVVRARVEPLLTMDRLRQPVAAGGNGICLFGRLPRRSDLPLTATSCNHGAP
jgi:hypothetical protein